MLKNLQTMVSTLKDIYEGRVSFVVKVVVVQNYPKENIASISFDL